MSVPTTSWDENSPAGSDAINLGDNKLREMKTQIREVMDVDHDFPSSGQAADVGQHKKVTLQEQADLGTGAVGTTLFGSQTTDGKGELTYTDEADNDIQITKDGKLHAPSLAGAYPAADLASIAAIMNFVYPVGQVVTLGVSTNPAVLYGVGTWTAIAGKVIVGIDGTQTEFDTLNETGGAKTVTLDTTMMPAHTHDVAVMTGGGGNNKVYYQGCANSTEFTVAGAALTTGGGLAHNNLQPYIVKYVWERTA